MPAARSAIRAFRARRISGELDRRNGRVFNLSAIADAFAEFGIPLRLQMLQRGGFLVNWKTDLRLSDLEAGCRIEATCKKCGLTHYEQAAQLLARPGMRHAWLDEVERRLCCASRFCRGPVRIALIHDDKTEGFVGGMA